MTPYYQDNAVTIYHGDCREYRFTTPAVLITDPPYGINIGCSAEKRPGRIIGTEKYASYDDTYENFLSVVIPAIEFFIPTCGRGAVFSGPHFQDYPRADALGGIYCPAANGRHKWGFNVFLPILFYGTDPNQHQGCTATVFKSNAAAADIGHPCPKPDEWMNWLVGKTSKYAETILDPFMGSGTTLRAAKDLGRKAIGIEIEEKYCEIAAKRMAQEVLSL